MPGHGNSIWGLPELADTRKEMLLNIEVQDISRYLIFDIENERTLKLHNVVSDIVQERRRSEVEQKVRGDEIGP